MLSTDNQFHYKNAPCHTPFWGVFIQLTVSFEYLTPLGGFRGAGGEAIYSKFEEMRSELIAMVSLVSNKTSLNF